MLELTIKISTVVFVIAAVSFGIVKKQNINIVTLVSDLIGLLV